MLRRLVDGFVDILYPRKCLSCKRKLDSRGSVTPVCSHCQAAIKKNTPPFCWGCGRTQDAHHITKHLCSRCTRTPASFDRAFSPCSYNTVLQELIHQFKYQSKEYLAPYLGNLMIEYIQEYNLPMGDIDGIIPIPLHPARLREREFNQAELLSRHIGEALKKKVLTNTLLRHRNTRTQAKLALHKRLHNVTDCFSVTGCAETKGKNFLLVDDVLTTAATSSEAARVLKEAGAHIIYVLTVAN